PSLALSSLQSSCVSLLSVGIIDLCCHVLHNLYSRILPYYKPGTAYHNRHFGSQERKN
ncbi:mCG145570, partial [Mus musculus]